MRVRSVLTGLIALATLAYPLVIWLSLGRVEPRWLALLLVVLALARTAATSGPLWLVSAAGTALLGLASLLSNEMMPLKLYPVLVNAVLLAVFGASLAWPPTVVERLARLQEPALSQPAIAYTRRVTQVWCGFFVVNGAMALGTATWASDEAWVLYNGLIAYVLMGALFGGEWLVRQRVKASLAAKGVHG